MRIEGFTVVFTKPALVGDIDEIFTERHCDGAAVGLREGVPVVDLKVGSEVVGLDVDGFVDGPFEGQQEGLREGSCEGLNDGVRVGVVVGTRTADLTSGA